MNMRKIRGFTLIEISFVIAIFAVILASLARYSGVVQEQAFGKVGGSQLKEMIGDGSKFMSANFESLANGVAIAGVANEYAPTFAELQALGIIQAGTPATNQFGSQWRFAITKQPVGCVAPACDLQVTVNTTAPVLYKGKVNYGVLKNIVDEVGNDASYSEDTDPANIHGVNNSWSVPNPVSATAIGVVLARAGFGAQGLSQFVRQGDSRNIVLNGGITNNGTLASNGNINLSGANGINLVSGNVTSTSGNVTAQNLIAGTSVQNYGYLNQAGPANFFSTITSTGAVTAGSVTAGTITAGVSSLGVATASNLTATGTVQGAVLNTSTIGVLGAPCSPQGIVAQDSLGLVISCSAGKWISASTKPCVHGSWSSSVPGTYDITIPAECMTITTTGYGGGGGGGYLDKAQNGYIPGYFPRAGAGGGATEATTVTTNRATSEVGTTFTAVVGAGGWRVTPWYAGAGGVNWYLYYRLLGGESDGQASSLNYKSPARVYALMPGASGANGWSMPSLGSWGNTLNAKTPFGASGGASGNPAVGAVGGDGANSLTGAPGGGGAPGFGILNNKNSYVPMYGAKPGKPTACLSAQPAVVAPVTSYKVNTTVVCAPTYPAPSSTDSGKAGTSPTGSAATNGVDCWTAQAGNPAGSCMQAGWANPPGGMPGAGGNGSITVTW